MSESPTDRWPSRSAFSPASVVLAAAAPAAQARWGPCAPIRHRAHARPTCRRMPSDNGNRQASGGVAVAAPGEEAIERAFESGDPFAQLGHLAVHVVETLVRQCRRSACSCGWRRVDSLVRLVEAIVQLPALFARVAAQLSRSRRCHVNRASRAGVKALSPAARGWSEATRLDAGKHTLTLFGLTMPAATTTSCGRPGVQFRSDPRERQHLFFSLAGSSPRGRGTPVDGAHRGHSHRFIPARAGNTC